MEDEMSELESLRASNHSYFLQVEELEARVKELEDWQDKALRHLPKPLRIDAAFVARVEERMGCGHTAWDAVDPRVLCGAVLLESGR